MLSSWSRTRLLTVYFTYFLVVRKQQENGKKEEDGWRRGDFTGKKKWGQKESLLPLKPLIWLSFDEFHIFCTFWLQWVLAPGLVKPLHSTSHQAPSRRTSCLLHKYLNAQLLPTPSLLHFMLEKEWEWGSAETWVWRGPLRQGWCVQHLCSLFTRMFTHCHLQLMVLKGLGCLPSTGPPWTLPRPLWVPNWACHTPDWINSFGLLDPFPLPGRGFSSSGPAEETERQRGAESCQHWQENVALAVDKAKLKMSTGGKQRSSWGQACLEDNRVLRLNYTELLLNLNWT